MTASDRRIEAAIAAGWPDWRGRPHDLRERLPLALAAADALAPPAPDVRPWRVGTHYGIHVYDGERPVATFFRAGEAERAVALYNAALAQEGSQT